MPISEWVEKLGRAIFESPFGAQGAMNDAPELAEVRLAVLDEVKAKSHRVAGRQVFPYNLVRIRLRGVPGDQDSIFTGPFFAQFCEQEIRAGLSRLSYRYPADLHVEVETTHELPGAGEQWLAVEAESHAAAAPARAAAPFREAPSGERRREPFRTRAEQSADQYRPPGGGLPGRRSFASKRSGFQRVRRGERNGFARARSHRLLEENGRIPAFQRSLLQGRREAGRELRPVDHPRRDEPARPSRCPRISAARWGRDPPGPRDRAICGALNRTLTFCCVACRT